MPTIAAFIDNLRAAGFDVNASMRRGMRGEPGWFHAREAGHEVGTAFHVEPGVTVEQMKNGKEEKRP